MEYQRWFLRRGQQNAEFRELEDQFVAQQKKVVCAVAEVVTDAYRTVEEGEGKGMWGGRKAGTKNVKRGDSNWMRDYLGSTEEGPRYPAYQFRRRFENSANAIQEIER